MIVELQAIPILKYDAVVSLTKVFEVVPAVLRFRVYEKLGRFLFTPELDIWNNGV